MSTEANKDIVRRWMHDGIAGKNLEVLKALVADDYKNFFRGEPVSAAALDDMFGMIWTAMPDMTYTLHSIVGEGDTVIVRFTVTATHAGEFGGVPATGIDVCIPGMAEYVLRDGKIVEDRPLLDMATFMTQVGAMPTAGDA